MLAAWLLFVGPGLTILFFWVACRWISIWWFWLRVGYYTEKRKWLREQQRIAFERRHSVTF